MSIRTRFTRKRLALIATAVSALLAGKEISFGGAADAKSIEAMARNVANAIQNTKPGQSLPAIPSTETNHLLSSMEFGRISRWLRRREPVWIGKPRPQNHMKYALGSSRTTKRGANGGTSRMGRA